MSSLSQDMDLHVSATLSASVDTLVFAASDDATVSVADVLGGHVANVGLGEGDRRANRTWDGASRLQSRVRAACIGDQTPDGSQIGWTDARIRDRPVLVPRDSACTRARVGSSFHARSLLYYPSRSTHVYGGRCCACGRPRRGGSGGSGGSGRTGTVCRGRRAPARRCCRRRATRSCRRPSARWRRPCCCTRRRSSRP